MNPFLSSILDSTKMPSSLHRCSFCWCLSQRMNLLQYCDCHEVCHFLNQISLPAAIDIKLSLSQLDQEVFSNTYCSSLQQSAHAFKGLHLSSLGWVKTFLSHHTVQHQGQCICAHQDITSVTLLNQHSAHIIGLSSPYTHACHCWTMVMSLVRSKNSAHSLLKPQYQRVCWYTTYVKSTLLMYLLSLSLLCQINCYVNQPSSLLLSFKAPLLPSHHCIKSLIVSLPFTVYEHHSYYCCRCQSVIIINFFTGCLSSWRYICHPYSFTVKYLTFRHILFPKETVKTSMYYQDTHAYTTSLSL